MVTGTSMLFWMYFQGMICWQIRCGIWERSQGWLQHFWAEQPKGRRCNLRRWENSNRGEVNLELRFGLLPDMPIVRFKWRRWGAEGVCYMSGMEKSGPGFQTGELSAYRWYLKPQDWFRSPKEMSVHWKEKKSKDKIRGTPERRIQEGEWGSEKNELLMSCQWVGRQSGQGWSWSPSAYSIPAERTQLCQISQLG